MNEIELQSLIRSEVDNCLGGIGSDLAKERANALERYRGDPYGDEVEGRSQVVSRDVADTIEWIMPSLLKVFTSSDKAVEFEPTGPEDEAAAKQETDIINHVFYKENDGFLLLYTWFKDALLQKNGIVKAYWDEKKTVKREEYKSLTEAQLIGLSLEDGVEIIEHEVRVEVDESTGYPVEEEVFDVAIRRTIPGTVVENVAPEDFGITRRHTSLDLKDVSFCYHRVRTTADKLIEQGIDKDLVESLSDDETQYDEEKLIRYDDEYPIQGFDADDDSRQITVDECYIRVDYDGDGIVELRKVLVASDSNTILDNEEIDCIPFHAITPTLMPHKFIGISVADQVLDIQRIKSVLLRQILDNLYLINNSRNVVVEGQVNLDDLLTSRQGGIIRAKAPGMVEPVRVQPFSGHTFGMLEQLESIKEARSGVARQNQGLDSNALNKTASGINQIMTQSQSRIQLIARVFAETGVKSLMKDIHRIELSHNHKKKTTRIRNQWVEVNPTEWVSRENMTVNVGLGTGDKDKATEQAMMLMGLQEKLMQSGLGQMVPPEKIYSALTKVVDTTEFKSVDTFFLNPKDAPPPAPPKPSDAEILAKQAAEEAQLKAQTEQQKAQLKVQTDQTALQAKIRMEQAELAQKAQLEREALAQEREIALLEIESKERIALANQGGGQ